ncbi:hypothetical protein Taro_053552 [Colocasia esculenta]|uniref:Uncharacterized protein n=1 Tax=Colocasia esculenta TaxID=4460 RepID=A0A843XN58_COLES|nr:hypothetical protein [Colocasia esculenta]
MVRGGRSGRGPPRLVHPLLLVCLPNDYAGCPGDSVRLPYYAGCLGYRVRLPYYADCPGDRVHFPHSSVTCPIPFSSRGREPSSSGGGGGSASCTLAMLDFWRRYIFTRPEDLPRARVVWESTAQTNFIKSMWEAQDKAAKITDSQDPTGRMDYGPVWMRRDYWGSLCHRWATGPWQERSQAAKRNRVAHPEKNVHTSGSVSYATHSQKLVSILVTDHTVQTR